MQVCLGRCEYDESLREQVWRARELEGLGETLLQLSLQVQVRGNSNNIVQVKWTGVLNSNFELPAVGVGLLPR